jgi:hypothetical protein
MAQRLEVLRPTTPLLDKAGILIKMLTHYAQIIGGLLQFNIDFADGLLFTLNIFANPIYTAT